MSDPLDDVRTIAAERRALEARYRGALQAARDAGHSGGAIGEAAGTTRQNILKLTTAPVVDDLAPMRARLEELDARWERLVDAMEATLVHPDAKREQLRRNTENGKRKRKNARAASAAAKRGFAGTTGIPLLPTVRNETRRTAEAKLLRLVEDHVDDPRFVGIVAELAEAEALRSDLTARTDPFWLHD